jgi:hypothetical protein
MNAFTGDTTVKAYTTGARAVLIQLTPRHSVTFDLTVNDNAVVTLAQMQMSAITAGLEAGLTTAEMTGPTIYLVA